MFEKYVKPTAHTVEKFLPGVVVAAVILGFAASHSFAAWAVSMAFLAPGAALTYYLWFHETP